VQSSLYPSTESAYDVSLEENHHDDRWDDCYNGRRRHRCPQGTCISHKYEHRDWNGPRMQVSADHEREEKFPPGIQECQDSTCCKARFDNRENDMPECLQLRATIHPSRFVKILWDSDEEIPHNIDDEWKPEIDVGNDDTKGRVQ